MVIGSLQQGGNEPIPKENRIITPHPGASISETPGRPVAERSVLVLPSRPTEPPSPTDVGAATPPRQRPPLNQDEIRSLPEVQPFLLGGEECRALSRKFELTRKVAIERYEILLADSLATCTLPLARDRIAKLAETAAKNSTEFVVRRIQTPKTDYRTLLAQLETESGERRRIGRFETRGVYPGEIFANFRKLDSKGVPCAQFMAKLMSSGDNKIHLNIRREHIHGAWEALRPLLLSGSNPFIHWKTAMLDHVDAHYRGRLEGIAKRQTAREPNLDAGRLRADAACRWRRIAEGMQFTLYPITPVYDSDYRVFGPQYRHFLTLLDWALADCGVKPGIKPESDVVIEGLEFATYRHGKCGSRGRGYPEPPVTDEMLRRLREAPFYRAIAS